MPLTNAERQRRYRDRLKAAASSSSGLTPEQIADRDAVMAEVLYPVPPVGKRAQMPRFMGWERYEWSAAPVALAEHFGMRSAWDGWKAEKDALESRQHEIHALASGRADRIVQECGEPAREILQRGGTSALFRAYEADSTLGIRARRRRPVT